MHSFVRSVKRACLQNIDYPAQVAKPSPYALKAIMADAGASRVLMVGDMWSDVEFAHNAGADAALVLSGVATYDDAASWRDRPDFVIEDLRALLAPPPPRFAPRRWRRRDAALAVVAAAAIAVVAARARRA